MKRLVFTSCASLAAWALLTACQPADSTTPTHPLSTASEKTHETDKALPAFPNDRQFQDVLNEYIGLNERLDRIAARLKIANADICLNTESDIGITTHTLTDYPEELRSAAAHYLNVGPDMSIRTVRAHSAAGNAGLRSGDRILKINGDSLTDGPLFSNPNIAGAMAKALFHAALDRVDKEDTAVIEYQRFQNAPKTVNLHTTKQCKLPVTLFFSDDVNGHYVDGEIWMTSGLLRSVGEDIQVAYIMAHEMAHALRHETGERTPEIELDADRIGLVLLARAGYDTAQLATFWAEQINLFDSGEDQSSESHPGLEKRADNYALTLSYIRAARGDNEKLKALIVSPQ